MGISKELNQKLKIISYKNIRQVRSGVSDFRQSHLLKESYKYMCINKQHYIFILAYGIL